MIPLNRHQRRADATLARRRSSLIDLRETVAADGTTVTLHPTKGFRRISGKRAEAQALMQVMYG